MINKYVEAPNQYRPLPGDGPPVFLLGGITDVWDWQKLTTGMLLASDVRLTVLNPRRTPGTFDVTAPGFDEEQGAWEFDGLHQPHGYTLAYLPQSEPHVVQPASMYEIGVQVSERRSRRLHIAIHPKFPRASYLRTQLKLMAPELIIHSELFDAVVALLAQMRADAAKMVRG